jgi:two-component system, OmpR family, osmolarity sensor histidine kinase EnvZ
MRFFPGSLLWRTLIVLVAALVLSQAAALWLLNEYVTKPRLAIGVGQFVSHLKTINAALQTLSAPQQEQFISQLAEREGIRITPVRGTERMRPADDQPQLRVFRERLRALFGPDTDVYVRAGDLRQESGSDTRPRVLWVKLAAGDRGFWVAIPRGRIERDTTSAFIAWGVAGLGIAILATFFIMWRLNRPLEELARAAVRIGKGGNPPPVAETGPTEIRAVARAFNQMKDDLRMAERERATFLAGISHDLRTPLARLRLDLEMLEGKVDAAVQRGMVDDLADMNAIIDQFIDFTRSEAAEPLSGVNLSELAQACAERARRSGVQVVCDLADVPMLMLRPLAMQRLVDNLLGNAARHAGGEVRLRTEMHDGKVVLSVLDRGPGIPPSLVEHVKQPFKRRDDARSGSSGAGLGLAIADRVAILHGGRLDLLPREGGGLEARVTLEILPGD